MIESPRNPCTSMTIMADYITIGGFHPRYHTEQHLLEYYVRGQCSRFLEGHVIHTVCDSLLHLHYQQGQQRLPGTHRKWLWFWRGFDFRGMDEDRVHLAVILPWIESVLSLAEISISLQPVFKSYFRCLDVLPCRQVPHILKSLSFSIAEQNIVKINKC